MIARTLSVIFFGLSAVSAQPIDARDNLVQPVNPPRNVSAGKEVSTLVLSESSKTHLRDFTQARADLKAALDAGLAENHPTVKAIRARLDVLKGQIVIQSAPKSEPNEIERLRKDISEMKSEIDKLKSEIDKLKNEK